MPIRVKDTCAWNPKEHRLSFEGFAFENYPKVNPNVEIRNPKQILNPNIQMASRERQLSVVLASGVWEHLVAEFATIPIEPEV